MGYGTPPVAPPAEPFDLDLLEQELLDAALADVPGWKVATKRSLRNEVREQAAHQARIETERLAVEEREVQQELDRQWAELQALRDRADREVEQWIAEETRLREAARAEQQALLDERWQQLIDADPASVREALRSACQGSAVTVLGSLDGVAVLVVECPEIDAADVVDGFAPDTASRPTVRTRSQAHMNELKLAAVASRVLAAVGRALSATPAVEATTCVAVRPSRSSDRPWEPIHLGTVHREY